MQWAKARGTACGMHRTARILAIAGITATVAAAAWVTATRAARLWWLRPRGAAGHLDSRGLHLEDTVTVMRPAEELYEYCRDLNRLPGLIPHLESVTPLDGGRSRWTVRGPRATRITWDAVLVADDPGRRIAWESVDGAIGPVLNSGSVSFTPAPGGRGTELKLVLSCSPPSDGNGAGAPTLLRQANQQVREGLRRFKQYVEGGEIAVASHRDGV